MRTVLFELIDSSVHIHCPEKLARNILSPHIRDNILGHFTRGKGGGGGVENLMVHQTLRQVKGVTETK